MSIGVARGLFAFSLIVPLFVIACSGGDDGSTGGGGGNDGVTQEKNATSSNVSTELASCCGGRAKCVPKARVSENRLENLDACEGSSDDVCVPLTFISNPDFKGSKCKGQVNISETSKLPYDGVCLSDCLNIPSKDLLSRDGCNAGDLCVPCTHPVTGVPTGAPGCE